LVKQNFVVPSGKLVAGVPAKVIRDLTKDEIKDIEAGSARYTQYARVTLDSLK